MFLCYRRGRDKAPLSKVGVHYQKDDSQVSGSVQLITKTPEGHSANVNNTSSEIYISYQREETNYNPNSLVVTDMCVVLGKQESVPHTFWAITERELNTGLIGSSIYLCYKKGVAKTDYLCFKPAIQTLFPHPNANKLRASRTSLDASKNSANQIPLPPYELPEEVPQFCLPMGATVEAWHQDTPNAFRVSKFVLTLSDEGGLHDSSVSSGELSPVMESPPPPGHQRAKPVQKLYGSSISFYEPLPKSFVEKLSLAQKRVLLRGVCGSGSEQFRIRYSDIEMDG